MNMSFIAKRKCLFISRRRENTGLSLTFEGYLSPTVSDDDLKVMNRLSLALFEVDKPLYTSSCKVI